MNITTVSKFVLRTLFYVFKEHTLYTSIRPTHFNKKRVRGKLCISEGKLPIRVHRCYKRKGSSMFQKVSIRVLRQLHVSEGTK